MPSADLYQLLQDYGLTSPKSLERTLSRFGRPRLIALLDELRSLGFQEEAIHPGQLGFLAAGGRLGLGSAERASRGLMLVADKILIPYELNSKADSLLTLIDNNPGAKGLASVRGQVLQGLHPYIFQYLQIHPLISAGFASLSTAPQSPSFELVHPLASQVNAQFLKWIRYGENEKAQPSFTMSVGDGHYFASPQMRAMEAQIVVGGAIHSTDEIQFRPWSMVGNYTNLDPSPLLNHEHPLWPAFENFISVELWKAEHLAAVAGLTNASVATDTESDWDLLNMLPNYSEDAVEMEPALAVVEALTETLPFVKAASVQEVVELREQLTLPFENFRNVLLGAARHVQTESDREKRAERARLAIKEDIVPRFVEYSAETNAAAGARLRNGAGALVAGGSLVALFALAGVTGTIAAGGVGAVAANSARSFLDKVLSAQETLEKGQGDPMFFLWKVSK